MNVKYWSCQSHSTKLKCTESENAQMCSFRVFSLDLQNHDIAVIFSNKHFTCVYKAQIVAFVCGSSGILSRVNTLNTYLYPTVEFNKMHTPKLLENKYLTLKNESCVTRFKFFQHIFKTVYKMLWLHWLDCSYFFFFLLVFIARNSNTYHLIKNQMLRTLKKKTIIYQHMFHQKFRKKNSNNIVQAMVIGTVHKLYS